MGIRDSLYCTMYWRFCQVVFLNDLFFFENLGDFFITYGRKPKILPLNYIIITLITDLFRIGKHGAQYGSASQKWLFWDSRKAAFRVTNCAFLTRIFFHIHRQNSRFFPRAPVENSVETVQNLDFQRIFPQSFPQKLWKTLSSAFLNFFLLVKFFCVFNKKGQPS